MKKNKITKILSLTLALFLLAAAGIMTAGCSDKNEKTVSSSTAAVNAKEVGTGKTSFFFTVTEKDESVTSFKVNTDEKTVGDALKKEGLIDGEVTQYGLTVTTVNGKTYDYNKDGLYWAFYVGGQYAQKGVSETEITPRETYGFKVEKG